MDAPQEHPSAASRSATSSPVTVTSREFATASAASVGAGAPEEAERTWREATGLTDPAEKLLGEFACAHHGDLVVSTGKMFLSTTHVSFHAAVGRTTMKRVLIRLVDIERIDKSVTNYAFSSGIKISTRTGGVRHFTSFSNRDRVFHVLTKHWKRVQSNSGDASRTLLPSPPRSSSLEDESRLVSAMAVDAEEGHTVAATVEDDISAFQSLSDLQAHVDAALDDGDADTSATVTGAPNAAPAEAALVRTSTRTQLRASTQTDVPTATTMEVLPIQCTHWTEPTVEPVETVTIDVSLEDFYARAVDDDGKFFCDYHKDAGLGGPDNKWIVPYPKTRGDCCFQRDFFFQQPITMTFPLAPNTTRVKQIHRWYLVSNDTLHLSTSSMMPDIPYGSSFSIETRWKVTRTGARSVSVTAYVEGQFNKWLFGFKSSVETLIKKDGVAYVSGLLARMKSLASPRKSLFKAPQSVPNMKKPALAAHRGSVAGIEPVKLSEERPRDSIVLTPKPLKPRTRSDTVWAPTTLLPWVVVVLLVALVGVLFWQVRALRGDVLALSRTLTGDASWRSRADLVHEVNVARVALSRAEALLKALEESGQ